MPPMRKYGNNYCSHRCSKGRWGSLDEAIKRVNAYIEAGADVGFVEALVSEEELRRVLKEVKVPIFYNMHGISPVLPFANWEDFSKRFGREGEEGLQWIRAIK